MDLALRSTVLSLLGLAGELEDAKIATPPVSTPRVRISGTEYIILSSSVDITLKDNTTPTSPSLLAARVILTVRRAAGTGTSGEAASPPVEVAAHAFIWSSSSTAVTRAEVILDTEALRSRQPLPAAAERAATIPAHPACQESRTSLAETYRSYIAAINARQMTTSLPAFCHPTVVHNGRTLALPTYQRLMTDAQSAIRDITFAVGGLVVDEESGMVAALLNFTGTAAGEFAGVEGTGREVRFGEIVFYWFAEGKISRVVSLVDVETYRAQARRN